MVTIEHGVCEQECLILIGEEDVPNLSANLWIKQKGLREDHGRLADSLSYISLKEMIQLRDELNTSIKKLTSVE